MPPGLRRTGCPSRLADVALRAGDGELLRVEDLAADLHAAVALAVLEADLESARSPCTSSCCTGRCVNGRPLAGIADDGAVLDAPVLLEPFPAVEVLAVEEAVGPRSGGALPRSPAVAAPEHRVLAVAAREQYAIRSRISSSLACRAGPPASSRPSTASIDSICLRLTSIEPVRVEHVGVDHHVVAVQVDDAAGDHAGRRWWRSIDGRVLVADDLARLDDRLEQVAGAEAAGDAGQVGPVPPPSLSKRWQAKHLAAANSFRPRSKSRPVQALLDDRHQLVERPLLDERPRLARRRRGRRRPASPPGSASARPSPASVSVGDGVALDVAAGSRGSWCRP